MAIPALLVSSKEDVIVASFNETKIVDQMLIQQIEQEFQTLAAQAASGQKLLIDFSRVEFISSMMIGLIVRLHSRCKREGIHLKLCAASLAILEAFRITGLRKVLEFHPDQVGALEAFGRSGLD